MQYLLGNNGMGVFVRFVKRTGAYGLTRNPRQARRWNTLEGAADALDRVRAMLPDAAAGLLILERHPA